MDLIEQVKEAKDEIIKNLRANNLDLPFMVKVVEGEGFIGMYVHLSMRNGTARIKISSSIKEQILEKRSWADINHELRVTIAHEMIHAIQDIAYFLANEHCEYDEDEAENLGIKLANGENIESSDLIKKLVPFMTDS